MAKNIEEACRLVEAGFEYVCDIDGVKIFRKPKWCISEPHEDVAGVSVVPRE